MDSLTVTPTNLHGLFVIEPKTFTDRRGSFTKVFREDLLENHGLKTDFQESYYSVSSKGVIRGMHFQVPPAAHSKLVYVNQGSILDVVLDIRRNSPTFGQHYKLKIRSNSLTYMYIPMGCAHGFLSLENNTVVTYLQTSSYNQECDKGINYNSFGMDWNITSPIISERDISFVDFKKFKTPF